MSPSFLNRGRGQDVLAGSRELKDAPTYQIGFVLPDMTVAARVAEQVHGLTWVNRAGSRTHQARYSFLHSIGVGVMMQMENQFSNC